MNNEIRVGLFFFVSLAALLGFTLFVTDIGGSDGAYAIAFDRVEGLHGGDAVTYNGVKVGQVRVVKPLIEDGLPRVVVRFDVDSNFAESVLIGDDTVFSINQGLLGGYRLSLVTLSKGGVGITRAKLDGRTGKEPVGLSDAIASLSDMIDENRESVRKAIDSLPAAVKNFSEMSSEIRDVVKENRPGLSKAVDNVGAFADNANQVVTENRAGIKIAVDNFGAASGEAKEMLQENRPQLKTAVDKLPGAVASITDTSDKIGATVDENRAGVKNTIANLSEFSPKLNQIGTDVGVVTKQIASGKGTVGKLVFEDTLHDKAEEALTSFEQRLEEIKPLTAGISDLKFYIGAYGASNVDQNSAGGGVYVRIEPRPWKLYEFAVVYRGAPADRDTLPEDPEDMNIEISFLYGRRFFADDAHETYRFTGKVGIIESKLGGIGEISLVPNRLSLYIMLRGKHNGYNKLDRRYEEGTLMARAYLEYRVWKRTYLYVGGDDLADNPGAYVGIRAEILDNDLRNAAAARSISP